MKPRLHIDGEGSKDKEDGSGKANKGSKKDLEELSKQISSNLSGFSSRHIDELQEIIEWRQDFILLTTESKKESEKEK